MKYPCSIYLVGPASSEKPALFGKLDSATSGHAPGDGHFEKKPFPAPGKGFRAPGGATREIQQLSLPGGGAASLFLGIEYLFSSTEKPSRLLDCRAH